jgi:hypothetical protein
MASWVASHLRADPGRVSLGKATGTTPKLTAGPARRGTARSAANLQICCGLRRTASLDIAAPTANQATL